KKAHKLHSRQISCLRVRTQYAPNLIADVDNVIARQRLVRRQGENSRAQFFSDRKLSPDAAERFGRWLQVDRRVGMHDSLHAFAGKTFLYLVPRVALGDEVDKGMEFVRLFLRQADQHPLQQFPVEGRIGTSAFDHLVEPAEPKAQDRSLQGVEPGDVAKLGDGIAVDETVVAQQPNAGGDVVGIGGDEAGVAQRIKNLERMSRETPDRTQ